MHIKSIFCLAILGISVYACSPKTATATQPASRAADKTTSPDKLAEGKTLYTQKCGKCHVLHSPSEYGAMSWSNYLDEMQPKAHIDDAQKTLIYNYLVHR